MFSRVLMTTPKMIMSRGFLSIPCYDTIYEPFAEKYKHQPLLRRLSTTEHPRRGLEFYDFPNSYFNEFFSKLSKTDPAFSVSSQMPELHRRTYSVYDSFVRGLTQYDSSTDYHNPKYQKPETGILNTPSYVARVQRSQPSPTENAAQEIKNEDYYFQKKSPLELYVTDELRDQLLHQLKERTERRVNVRSRLYTCKQHAIGPVIIDKETLHVAHMFTALQTNEVVSQESNEVVEPAAEDRPLFDLQNNIPQVRKNYYLWAWTAGSDGILKVAEMNLLWSEVIFVSHD